MAAVTLLHPINVTLINAWVSGDKEQHATTGIYHAPIKGRMVQTNMKTMALKKKPKTEDKWLSQHKDYLKKKSKEKTRVWKIRWEQKTEGKGAGKG